MPLPLDPDDPIEAASYWAAGFQRLSCGHDVDKGETLIELTSGDRHFGTVCSVCYAAVGHRIVHRSGVW